MINCGNWKLFDNTENLLIIVELLYDWFDDCVGFVVSPERTKEIMEKNNIHTESDGINNIKIFGKKDKIPPTPARIPSQTREIRTSLRFNAIIKFVIDSESTPMITSK